MALEPRGISLGGILLNPSTTLPSRPRGSKSPVRGSVLLKISPRTLKNLKDVFELLADELRLKILLALSEEGEMHVSALRDLLGKTQPAISHHLKLLRMMQIVGFRREGKHNYYRLESNFVRDLLEQFFTDTGNGHKSLLFEDLNPPFKRK
jgi:ArsR family transcriptional regulator